MQSKLLMDKYPIHTLTIEKSTVSLLTVDEVVAALKRKITEDANAEFISIYDHLAHTQALPEGEVAEGIKAVKLLIFCFGVKIPNPEVIAVRPRSIGVTEYADRFVIAFMTAPNPVMNDTMLQWVNELTTA